ncbi:hypothetical protein [Saccharothrix luteola]|uniref:hypothetical protein n=1 Tax=Saccharothrix luteola TaxID=2893018 RepID=UPI001E4FF3BF|nr:hypothetical protein [Saccharothrix luteola]MCC8251036.1 hypothetical protein [Saccharothrix luteola]
MDEEELLARLCQDVVDRCDGAWRAIGRRAEFGEGWFSRHEDVDGEGRVRGRPEHGLSERPATHFGRTDLELRINTDRSPVVRRSRCRRGRGWSSCTSAARS